MPPLSKSKMMGLCALALLIALYIAFDFAASRRSLHWEKEAAPAVATAATPSTEENTPAKGDVSLTSAQGLALEMSISDVKARIGDNATEIPPSPSGHSSLLYGMPDGGLLTLGFYQDRLQLIQAFDGNSQTVYKREGANAYR